MHRHLQLATIITELLENRFNFLGLKFGLDPLLGLIPGIGDFIGLFLSLYLLWIGVRMNLPSEKISKMFSNIVFDFVLGLIPVVGDVGDFVFRANSKNLEILRSHMHSPIVEGEIIS